jgi:hypothetical protein
MVGFFKPIHWKIKARDRRGIYSFGTRALAAVPNVAYSDLNGA